MKIAEFLEDLEKADANLKPREGSRSYKELCLISASVWSNYACIGYVKQAMKGADLDEEQQQSLLRNLRRAFDDITVEQAEDLA